MGTGANTFQDGKEANTEKSERLGLTNGKDLKSYRSSEHRYFSYVRFTETAPLLQSEHLGGS